MHKNLSVLVLAFGFSMDLAVDLDTESVSGVAGGIHPVQVGAGAHGLTFPIYEDRDRIFRTEYRVEHYPLEVDAGASGQVHSASYDSVSPIDVTVVEEWLDR